MPRAFEFNRRRFIATASSIAIVAALPARASASSATTSSATKGDSMTTLTPYLLFDGDCDSAMRFYQSAFGGELTATKVKDSPAKDHMAPFQQEKIVNARLESGAIQISASDWLMLNRTRVPGNSVCLYLSGGSAQELKTLFQKLSEGADVTDPLREVFFGTYGALNDKFGVRWMFQANAQSA
jgi:PhnB protein